MPTRALTVAERAWLEQVLLGLRPIADLGSADGDVFTDDEGTPIARHDGDRVTLLSTTPTPSPVRLNGPAVIPQAERLPAMKLPIDATLLLPIGGAPLDDRRHLAWTQAWSTAAARVVPVPVAASEVAALAPALIAAFSVTRLIDVVTEEQPASGGRVVLLSGLSGSGKSTIARSLVGELVASRTVTLLDGDVVRTHLSKGLGFSRDDRDTNVRRIGWVAAEVAKHGGLAVCAPIAPYDETRRWVRRTVEAAAGPGSFTLVWVSTPIEVCEARDVKGLYAQARAGELVGFTGIDDPYEPPTDADLVIDTSQVPLDAVVQQVIDLLPNR